MKKRYISENLMELLSTIELCNGKDLAGLIVSFDFEKAFDHVEWDSLNLLLILAHILLD